MKKSAGEASRLAEELRQTHDHAEQMERSRRSVESHLKEMQTRLEETEAAAIQGGNALEVSINLTPKLQTDLFIYS